VASTLICSIFVTLGVVTVYLGERTLEVFVFAINELHVQIILLMASLGGRRTDSSKRAFIYAC
jgi:hypothetical protein